MPADIVPCNPISAKVAQKFIASAQKIEQAPWFLRDGGAYLRQMAVGTTPKPPVLTFAAAAGRVQGVTVDPVAGAAWYDFAPQPPKPVRILHAALRVASTTGEQAAVAGSSLIAAGAPGNRIVLEVDAAADVPSSQEFLADLPRRAVLRRPAVAVNAGHGSQFLDNVVVKLEPGQGVIKRPAAAPAADAGARDMDAGAC